MTLQDEQIAMEQHSVTRGINRIREQIKADEAAGRAFDSGVGQAMARRLVENSESGVKELRRQAKRKLVEAETTGRRLSGWEMPAAVLGTDEMAYIAVRTMLNHAGRDKTIQHVAQAIGDICHLQVRWADANRSERARVKGEDPDPIYNRINYMKRQVKGLNPKSVSKWLKKLDDLALVEWDRKTRFALGQQLLAAILEQCNTVFDQEHILKKNGGGQLRQKVRIILTPEAKEHLERRIQGSGLNSPWMLPMITQPTDRTNDTMGGYLKLPTELVKTIGVTPYDAEVPQVALDALNAVQRTGWRINGRVLALALQAHAEAMDDLLPVSPVKELPEEVPADKWEAMTEEEKRDVKASRASTHDRNFRLESKRQVVRRQLEVADSLKDRGAIYFPHCFDFRGRMYPLPQDLHPQADEFGKALLTFSEAKPLGQRGFEWLQYVVATSYGNKLDKASRDEQLDWCYKNRDKITALASDPFGAMRDWWATAEEPWMFMAACLELVAAMEHGSDDYECSLPIHVDGTCDGLQHLSAMGLDEVGAKAVNLAPGEREDIYQIVADKVDAAVKRDEVVLIEGEKGRDEACAWYGHVTRAVVKRGVMTKPYGLTFVGMRDQLVADRERCWPEEVKASKMNRRELATYLRDRMSTAIEDTVHASVHVMEWMQAVARLFAAEGKGTMWTSPAGFEVDMRYTKQARKVYTVTGVILKTRRQISMYEDTGEINAAKQALAVAPNIVHSFDAAHMQLAIVRSDVSAVSAVHDSFGCHACDMDGFLAVIKDTFIEIYSEPVLADLHREFVAQAPAGVEVPPPPALGNFDIQEVARSDWFFA